MSMSLRSFHLWRASLGVFAFVPVFLTNCMSAAHFYCDDPRVKYFEEVALGAEYGNRTPVVKKWNRTILYRIAGNPSEADIRVLRNVIAELEELSSNIRFERVDPELDYNCVVHFVPKQKFSEYLAIPEQGPNGYFAVWFDHHYLIYRAAVLIASDIPQPTRSSVIREEVTQSLGVLNDSARYADSIFNKHSDVRRFSELDRWVIGALYSENIHPGMRSLHVRRVLCRMLDAQ